MNEIIEYMELFDSYMYFIHMFPPRAYVTYWEQKWFDRECRKRVSEMKISYQRIRTEDFMRYKLPFPVLRREW